MQSEMVNQQHWPIAWCDGLLQAKSIPGSPWISNQKSISNLGKPSTLTLNIHKARWLSLICTKQPSNIKGSVSACLFFSHLLSRAQLWTAALSRFSFSLYGDNELNSRAHGSSHLFIGSRMNCTHGSSSVYWFLVELQCTTHGSLPLYGSTSHLHWVIGAGKCPVRRLQRIEYIYLIATPLPEAEIHRITKWAIISNEGSQPVVQKSFNTGQSLLLCWPRLSTLDNQLRSLPRSLLRMGIVRSRSTFLVTFRPYLVVYGRFSGRE